MRINDRIIKIIICVDDIIVFIRNQIEIDVLIEILNLYNKVIKFKIN